MRPVQMSNSSPTILEKIVMGARRKAYANARRLGVDPIDAAIEANEAAAFINQVAESIPISGESSRWSWLWR